MRTSQNGFLASQADCPRANDLQKHGVLLGLRSARRGGPPRCGRPVPRRTRSPIRLRRPRLDAREIPSFVANVSQAATPRSGPRIEKTTAVLSRPVARSLAVRASTRNRVTLPRCPEYCRPARSADTPRRAIRGPITATLSVVSREANPRLCRYSSTAARPRLADARPATAASAPPPVAQHALDRAHRRRARQQRVRNRQADLGTDLQRVSTSRSSTSLTGPLEFSKATIP